MHQVERIFFFLLGFALWQGLGLFYPYLTIDARFKSVMNNCLITFLNSILVIITFKYVDSFIPNSLFQSLFYNLEPYTRIMFEFILLDFFIYWQHRVFHYVKLFWSIHALHHCDRHMDTSTALRFHTLEIFISLLLKIIIYCIFDISLLGILFFEVGLNFFAMFNHANFSLPQNLEKILRLIVVTPNVHRVHHQKAHNLHNSNFGFCLIIWDWVFRTYHACEVSRENCDYGLKGHEDRDYDLLEMLKFPFKN